MLDPNMRDYHYGIPRLAHPYRGSKCENYGEFWIAMINFSSGNHMQTLWEGMVMYTAMERSMYDLSEDTKLILEGCFIAEL